MTTYHFDAVSAPTSRTLKCACGKRFKRSATITNTVSPFNRDPETGQQRTYQQVWECVQAKAAEWQPDKLQRECPACGEQAEVVAPKVRATR
jgi:hypothetical protein